MALKSLFVAFLLIVQSATAVPYVEQRDGSVCQSNIYGELAPILAQYPIAQTFCSVAYPVPCTSAEEEKHKKRAFTTSTSKTTASPIVPAVKTTPVKTSSTAPSTNQNAQASAWSKCQGQPGNVISTMCSCIETPKPCSSSSKTTHTTTTSSTTTSSSHTTSSSTTSSSTTSSSTTSSSTTSSSTTSSSTTSSSTTSSSTTSSSTTSSSTTSSSTTSSSTTTTTATTTTSTTTTTSAAPTCSACTSGSYPPQDTTGCGCTYTISCGMQVVSTTSGYVYTYPAGTFTCYTDCVDLCDHVEACSIAEFNLLTTECTIYYEGVCGVITAPNPNYVIGQIQYGTCDDTTQCGPESNSNYGLGAC